MFPPIFSSYVTVLLLSLRRSLRNPALSACSLSFVARVLTLVI